jgi:hypothetical protein
VVVVEERLQAHRSADGVPHECDVSQIEPVRKRDHVTGKLVQGVLRVRLVRGSMAARIEGHASVGRGEFADEPVPEVQIVRETRVEQHRRALARDSVVKPDAGVDVEE